MCLDQGQSLRGEVGSLRVFADVVKFKMEDMAATIQDYSQSELAELRSEVRERLASLGASADAHEDAYSDEASPESDDDMRDVIEQDIATLKSQMVSLTNRLDLIAATARYVDGRT